MGLSDKCRRGPADGNNITIEGTPDVLCNHFIRVLIVSSGKKKTRPTTTANLGGFSTVTGVRPATLPYGRPASAVLTGRPRA